MHREGAAESSMDLDQCGAQVVDVDMGSSVPTITNLRALPCPTDALWPQVVFDLDYPGGTYFPHHICHTFLPVTFSLKPIY